MKLFFAILIVLIGGYLFVSGTNVSWFGFGKDDSRRAGIEGVKQINVDISGINTSIKPEDRSDIKVDLVGKGELDLNRKGDELDLNYRRGWFNWFSFGRGRLTIHIPEDYDRRLVIDNGSGSLELIGPSVNKPMKLSTLRTDMSSGNVTLKNLITETFIHDGSSGNVNIRDMKTESSIFDISSGNVRIKHFAGGLKASLSSGNFEVQMDELIGDVDVDVSSGSSNLDLPDNADFKLKGKTSSGDIDCRIPLENQTIEKKRIEGSHGSGKYLIDLSVSSGSIEVH